MSNIQVHKIQACKFDYEFLGKSTSQLAKDYGFREQDILEEIEIKGWERKIEPTALPNTTDMQQFADALETITRSKLSIISLFRQIDHQPLIAQLEKTFLEKALLLASELNSMDDRASAKLNNLVKAVETIQNRDPINLADQVKDQLKNGGSGVTVQILNQIN
jgi:hypothetical protein